MFGVWSKRIQEQEFEAFNDAKSMGRRCWSVVVHSRGPKPAKMTERCDVCRACLFFSWFNPDKMPAPIRIWWGWSSRRRRYHFRNNFVSLSKQLRIIFKATSYQFRSNFVSFSKQLPNIFEAITDTSHHFRRNFVSLSSPLRIIFVATSYHFRRNFKSFS